MTEAGTPNSNGLPRARPVLRRWFSPMVEYEGAVTLTFEEPVGLVHGEGRFVTDEDGTLNGTVVVPSRHPSTGLDTSLLILGMDPATGGWNSNSPRVPCRELTLSSDDGVLRSWGRRVHAEIPSVKIELSEPQPATCSLHISGLQATFTPSSDSVGESHYVVAPLRNFEWQYLPQFGGLTHHPMRIVGMPSKRLMDGAKGIEWWDMVNRNLHVPFLLDANERYGFVEPLWNRADRLAKVQSGGLKGYITAIAVLDQPGVTAESVIQDETPIGSVTWALSFATGQIVSAPFIELRDKRRRLASRVHFHLWKDDWAERYSPLKGFHGCLGEWVSDCIRSPLVRQQWSRVLLRHIIEAGKHSLTPDEKLVRLFQSLDMLVEKGPLSIANPAIRKRIKAAKRPQDYGVSSETVQALTSLLAECERSAQELLRLEDGSGPEGPASEYLRRLAPRISGSMVFQAGMGDRMTRFLKELDIRDEVLLNPVVERERWMDERTWTGFLWKLRGMVMHDGYLSHGDRIEETDRRATIVLVHNCVTHLLDLSYRIVMRIVGYSGLYDSPCWPGTAGLLPDRVKSDSPPSTLGYERDDLID